ncbi:MAG: type II toxin-antitoxin system VapC family toxin [Thermomicrobiales bacterium]|nr:type II toxin-antitoxin system VapC family toxin [Thermomicrobiales bacterium]
MIVVDASVWLSAILESDIHHHETLPWRTSIERTGEQIAVPSHFPAEVAGVLSRTGSDRLFITGTLDLIGAESLFTIYPIDVQFGLACAELANSAAVRGSDAIYLALARFLQVPLLSWDRQQRERGALFCRTMTPVEAMEMTA